jgi:hypothetical protein
MNRRPALDTIGKITHVEGRVEVVRDGAPLEAKLVKEGLDLANFDLLKTGGDGQVPGGAFDSVDWKAFFKRQDAATPRADVRAGGNLC